MDVIGPESSFALVWRRCHHSPRVPVYRRVEYRDFDAIEAVSGWTKLRRPSGSVLNFTQDWLFRARRDGVVKCDPWRRSKRSGGQKRVSDVKHH